MGNCFAFVGDYKTTGVPIRHVVYGVRNRTGLHFPILAFAGLGRNTHSVRCGLSYKPLVGDLRLFLQL